MNILQRMEDKAKTGDGDEKPTDDSSSGGIPYTVKAGAFLTTAAGSLGIRLLVFHYILSKK